MPRSAALVLVAALWWISPAAWSYEPLGSPAARSGGTFVFQRSEEPNSLNPIVSDGHQAVDIQFLVIEPLLVMDAETSEWTPALAKSGRVHPDGKTYDFELRADAEWSDGKPVTAEDVKFSFDVLFNPNFPTAHMRPYYEGIASVEALSPRRVRFHAKNTYFGNFISSAGLPVVPKHIYGVEKAGPSLHESIVGSGPYRFSRWEKGVRIVLERNPRWWGRRDPLYLHAYNPDRIVFRFISNELMAFEMLRKGELDFMGLTPDAYAKRTSGAGWGKRAFKAKVNNAAPKSYQFIALNLDRPLFQDRRVRLALAHLIDRRLMAERFHFGLALPATGPWNQQSPYADPSVGPIPFDPARALELLREAGWEDTDGDGILDKEIDGVRRPLKFTILTGNRAAERYLTMFQEDARQAGVSVEIKYLDWTVLGSVLDRRQFDAFQMDWGGGLVDFDPKSMWHSSSAAAGANNIAGYRSPEVDRLIERARLLPDRERRIPLLREAYRRIAHDLPCLFLFDEAYSFYAYSARVGRPTESYRYDIGTKYWWVNP